MKFKSDIEVQAGLRDSSGAIGSSGQILSSTGTNVSWITRSTVATDVQNQVKASVAINKGQAVYVTGADGTNIIVGLASNASEATSSKTLGLLDATVAINGFANVVQIGKLSGLNTLGATAGDPVWLGTGGNLIYGLIGKPYAPANLVFIGIVTRVNVSNGEIFVNVQNGFELNEIHDVDLKTTVPVNGDILGFNGTLWVNKTIAGWLGYTPANASGTTNYVSKFTGTTTLGNSLIYDNGTNVGINNTSPNYALDVIGSASISSNIYTNNVFGLSFGTVGYANSNTLINTYTGKDILFSVNNSEKMRVTSAGDVGIGTSSPISKLHTTGTTTIGGGVFSSSGTMQLLTGGASPISNRITYSTDGTGWKFAIGKNQAGTVTDQFVIQDNGNVGIGTTSPLTKLHIEGDASSTTDETILTLKGNGENGKRIDFRNVFGSLARITGTKLAGGASADEGILTFETATNSVLSEKMRITSSGNVGIGTTNPSQRLTVGDGTGTGNQYVRINSSSADIYIGQQGSTLFGIAANSSQLIVGDNTSFPLVIGTTASQPFILGTTNNERVRITSTGNVGIGTSIPASKLTVNTTTNENVAIGSLASIPTGRTLILQTSATGGSIETYSSLTGGYVNTLINPNGGNVGIGTTSPSQLLHVAGNARITGAVYDSSNSAGSSGQVLSSTGTGTAWVTGGGGGGISGSGTTNTLPKFTGSTAIGDSNISDNGTLITTTTDASVNGVKVGRGAGNISTNTVVGGAAFTANSSGSNNTAIGYAAGKYIEGSGNTFIGSDALKDPVGINFSGNNTLSITKNSSTHIGYPHFWAPNYSSIDDADFKNIIEIDVEKYSGFFLDYVFQEGNGSSSPMQSGTIRAIFLEDGSLITWSNDNILSIGDTSKVIIRALSDTSIAYVRIDNNLGNSKPIFVNFTARLILRQPTS